MTFASIRRSWYSRTISICLTVTFMATMVITPKASANVMGLPQPGTMVNLSSAYVPLMVTGLTVHPENPLLMDFIVSTGNSGMNAGQVKKESDRLIKYFLACLTIPEEHQWVNLSPYEKQRILPEDLGQTVLGRDMLAQDYILKQLTASLIYPEKNLGKNFWDTVYAKAREMYGTTQIPVNTFNKVWILPQYAKVFTHNNTVYVVKSHLRVMLDQDYLSLVHHSEGAQSATEESKGVNNLGSNIIRQIVLPAIEQEVNTGKNFAQLRQIYNSMILAVWFKANLKQALLNQVYTDKSKVSGVTTDDPSIKQKIYQQYIEAYKKGVFNYIKEETDQASQQVIPRKYFSGGVTPFGAAMISTESPAQLAEDFAQRPAQDEEFRVRELNTISSSVMQVDVQGLKAQLPGLLETAKSTAIANGTHEINLLVNNGQSIFNRHFSTGDTNEEILAAVLRILGISESGNESTGTYEIETPEAAHIIVRKVQSEAASAAMFTDRETQVNANLDVVERENLSDISFVNYVRYAAELARKKADLELMGNVELAVSEMGKRNRSTSDNEIFRASYDRIADGIKRLVGTTEESDFAMSAKDRLISEMRAAALRHYGEGIAAQINEKVAALEKDQSIPEDMVPWDMDDLRNYLGEGIFSAVYPELTGASAAMTANEVTESIPEDTEDGFDSTVPINVNNAMTAEEIAEKMKDPNALANNLQILGEVEITENSHFKIRTIDFGYEIPQQGTSEAKKEKIYTLTSKYSKTANETVHEFSGWGLTPIVMTEARRGDESEKNWKEILIELEFGVNPTNGIPYRDGIMPGNAYNAPNNRRMSTDDVKKQIRVYEGQGATLQDLNAVEFDSFSEVKTNYFKKKFRREINVKVHKIESGRNVTFGIAWADENKTAIVIETGFLDMIKRKEREDQTHTLAFHMLERAFVYILWDGTHEENRIAEYEYAAHYRDHKAIGALRVNVEDVYRKIVTDSILRPATKNHEKYDVVREWERKVKESLWEIGVNLMNGDMKDERVRWNESDPEFTGDETDTGDVTVGVFGAMFNPGHYGQTEAVLRAIAALKISKVAYVDHGYEYRKMGEKGGGGNPTFEEREEMLDHWIGLFDGLIIKSTVLNQSEADGETKFQKLIQMNGKRKGTTTWVYTAVGGDHEHLYAPSKAKDAKGYRIPVMDGSKYRPDTATKQKDMTKKEADFIKANRMIVINAFNIRELYDSLPMPVEVEEMRRLIEEGFIYSIPHINLFDTSSTNIRNHFSGDKTKDISFLSRDVANYIETHGRYRGWITGLPYAIQRIVHRTQYGLAIDPKDLDLFRHWVEVENAHGKNPTTAEISKDFTYTEADLRKSRFTKLVNGQLEAVGTLEEAEQGKGVSFRGIVPISEFADIDFTDPRLQPFNPENADGLWVKISPTEYQLKNPGLFREKEVKQMTGDAFQPGIWKTYYKGSDTDLIAITPSEVQKVMDLTVTPMPSLNEFVTMEIVGEKERIKTLLSRLSVDELTGLGSQVSTRPATDESTEIALSSLLQDIVEAKASKNAAMTVEGVMTDEAAEKLAQELIDFKLSNNTARLNAEISALSPSNRQLVRRFVNGAPSAPEIPLYEEAVDFVLDTLSNPAMTAPKAASTPIVIDGDHKLIVSGNIVRVDGKELAKVLAIVPDNQFSDYGKLTIQYQDGRVVKRVRAGQVIKLFGAEARQFKEPASAAMTAVPVEFMNIDQKTGTNGWRTSIDPEGDLTKGNFNLYTVGRMAYAWARHLNEVAPGQRVVVGFDNRPNSDVFALLFARVLRSQGIEVVFSNRPTSSPAIMRVTNPGRAENIHFGFLVTASHNSPFDNGIKWYRDGVVMSDTEAIPVTAGVKNIDSFPEVPMSTTYDLQPGEFSEIDSLAISQEHYERNFQGLAEAISAYRAKTGVWTILDQLHGSSSGLADYLRRLGVEVIQDRTVPMSEMWKQSEFRNRRYNEPGKKEVVPFRPEPKEVFLHERFQEFKSNAPAGSLYFAIDGDADRLAVWIKLADGSVMEVAPNDLGVLYGWMLVNQVLEQEYPSTGEPRVFYIDKTQPTTTGMDFLVEYGNKLAQSKGKNVVFKLRVTPVGSKNFAPEYQNGTLLIGVEESGHIVIKDYFDDAVGQLHFLLRALADSGASLNDTIFRAKKAVGDSVNVDLNSWVYARVNPQITPKFKSDFLDPIDAKQPEVALGHLVAALGERASQIREVRMTTVSPTFETGDVKLRGEYEGLRAEGHAPSLKSAEGMILSFNDGSWLMVRVSGTEGVVRVYAEAPSKDDIIAMQKAVVAAFEVGIVFDAAMADVTNYDEEDSDVDTAMSAKKLALIATAGAALTGAAWLHSNADRIRAGANSALEKINRGIQQGVFHHLKHGSMKAPGGIDLNSRNLNLESSGQKVNITFNQAMIAQFKRGDFSGVKIRILDVEPINLMPLLGLKEDEQVGQLVKA